MPHVWQCSNCVLNFSRRLYRQDQVDRVAHADIVKAENRNRWFYASSNLDTANAQRVKPETALLIKSHRRSVDVRPADEQLLCAMRTQVGDGRAEQRLPMPARECLRARQRLAPADRAPVAPRRARSADPAPLVAEKGLEPHAI